MVFDKLVLITFFVLFVLLAGVVVLVEVLVDRHDDKPVDWGRIAWHAPLFGGGAAAIISGIFAAIRKSPRGYMGEPGAFNSRFL